MESADKLAVAEALYRYAAGVDRRDWTLYRSVFADTLTIDFSSLGPGQAPRVMLADDYVAGVVTLFSGLAASQHAMTNPLAVVDGDTATITMNVHARHVYQADDPASWYTVGGYYDNTLVRGDGGWLLTGVRLTITWRDGNPAIMELARAAGKRLLRSNPEMREQ